MTTPVADEPRRVVAFVTVTMDGCTSGPDGPGSDTWLYEHAVREPAATLYEGVWRSCSSALVGRRSHEGFAAVWPGIAEDPATDDRTRDLPLGALLVHAWTSRATTLAAAGRPG